METVDLDTTYRGGKPEVGIHIDRDRAADLGVPVSSIATTVRYLMAGDPVGQLKDGVDLYDITLRMSPTERARIEQLPNIAESEHRNLVISRTSCTWRAARGRAKSSARRGKQRSSPVLAGLRLALGEATKAVDKAAKR